MENTYKQIAVDALLYVRANTTVEEYATLMERYIWQLDTDLFCSFMFAVHND